MSPNLEASEEVLVGKDSDECAGAATGRGDGPRGERRFGDRGCGDDLGLELSTDEAGLAAVSSEGSGGTATRERGPALESRDRAAPPPTRAAAGAGEV